VTLKRTTVDAETNKTHQDQSDGSSTITPQHSGLEEEKYNKTHKTQEMRGNDFDGCKRNLGCDIFKKKYPTLSQDGSSGSGGSIAETDRDPTVVHAGSELGLDPGNSQSCGRCGNLSMELIDLPGGAFCVICAEELQAQDAARKETPRAEDEEQSTSCLACGTPIGVGHGTYSGIRDRILLPLGANQRDGARLIQTSIILVLMLRSNVTIDLLKSPKEFKPCVESITRAAT
jgi:hypothetical protein